MEETKWDLHEMESTVDGRGDEALRVAEGENEDEDVVNVG